MKSHVFIILVFMSFPTFARETIFSYVSNRCHSTFHGMSGSRFKSTVRETIKASFLDSNSLVSIFEQKGLSANIQLLLSSKEYYEALDDCYGSDSLKKNIFTGSLIVEDITARAAGVLYAAGFYYLTGKLLLSLTLHYPALGKILLTSGIGIQVGYAVHILREHYREDTPDEKRKLEKFLSQNSEKKEVLTGRAIAIVENEIAEIDALLAAKSEPSLVDKRQKLVEALTILRKS